VLFRGKVYVPIRCTKLRARSSNYTMTPQWQDIQAMARTLEMVIGLVARVTKFGLIMWTDVTSASGTENSHSPEAWLLPKSGPQGIVEGGHFSATSLRTPRSLRNDAILVVVDQATKQHHDPNTAETCSGTS